MRKDSSNKRLMGTAFHEAGHAIASFEEGIRVRKVSIVPKEGYLGICYSVFKPPKNLDCLYGTQETNRARLKIEPQVVVSMAGQIAQKKFNPKGTRHWSGGPDFHSAINVLSYLCGSNEQLEAYLNYLYVRAKDLVECRWVWIQAVAEALLEKKELSGDEVRKIVLHSNERRIQEMRKAKAA